MSSACSRPASIRSDRAVPRCGPGSGAGRGTPGGGRPRAVPAEAGATALATQPPEEASEFAWNGVDFTSRRPDGRGLPSRRPDGPAGGTPSRPSRWSARDTPSPLVPREAHRPGRPAPGQAGPAGRAASAGLPVNISRRVKKGRRERLFFTSGKKFTSYENFTGNPVSKGHLSCWGAGVVSRGRLRPGGSRGRAAGITVGPCPLTAGEAHRSRKGFGSSLRGHSSAGAATASRRTIGGGKAG
jgi:hypothetical protein